MFRNSWIPNYSSRKLQDGWVVANMAGGWSLLTDVEFEELESVALKSDLFGKLESKCIILTEKNSAEYFARYRRWTTPHFRHPVHHIVVTTLRCNMSCLYCHAAVVPASASSQNDLSEEQATAIMDFATKSKAPEQSFEFQGGESLLNGPALKYMIPELRRRYDALGIVLHISMQTNATLMTKRWRDFFDSYDVSIGTSIDGDSNVHDKQRPLNNGQGSYALVRKKATEFSLPILPTITGMSVNDWRNIVDMQLEGGATTVAFQSVYPINSAKENWSKVGIEFREFLIKYDTVVEYLKSLWGNNFYPMERRFRLALKKLTQGKDVDFADFGNPCGMVHSQIVYHTNGDVYTCDEGRDFPEFRLGTVSTDSYDSVVFGRRMRELKSLSLPNDDECKTCAYRSVCSTCPVYERAVAGELTARHAGTDNCLHTKYIYDKLLSWASEDSDLLDKLAKYHKL